MTEANSSPTRNASDNGQRPPSSHSPTPEGKLREDPGRSIYYPPPELRQELNRILEELSSELGEERIPAVVGTDTVGRWRRRLERVRERLDEDFVIAVVGHFKRGKSTLVNALLGMAVTTTDVAPETVTFNEIRSGDELTAEACLEDGGRVSLRPEELHRERLEQVLSTLPQPVRCLSLRVPAPWLGGVCLVDTPGTDDLFQRFDRKVHDYLSKADAVLYLFSPLSPVSDSERQFLRLAILPRDFAKVTFVVNMLDKIEDEADARRSLELIRHRLSMLLPEAPVFGVSALDEIARHEDGQRPRPDRARSLAEDFDALRNHLRESILDNRELIQLERGISDAGSALNEIEQDLEALQGSFDANRQQVRAALEQCTSKDSVLHRANARAIDELEERMRTLSSEACAWLEAFSSRLANCFDGLDRYSSEDLQRHFPFFLAETLRSALRECVECHRPTILELCGQTRAELAAKVQTLLDQATGSAERQATAGGHAIDRAVDHVAERATFSDELWEEFEAADLLTELISSDLFRFGADVLMDMSKSAQEDQRIARFQRKLARSLPKLRKDLLERTRELYRQLTEHLVQGLQERHRQIVDDSRRRLEQARDLDREARQRLQVPKTLAAIRQRMHTAADTLRQLRQKTLLGLGGADS